MEPDSQDGGESLHHSRASVSLCICAFRKGRRVPWEGFPPPQQCPAFLNSGGEECHWPVGPSLAWPVIVQFLWPGLFLLVPPAGAGTGLQAL